MEIAGIDQRLIGWQSTRRQQTADTLPVLVADYETQQAPAEGSGAAVYLTGRPAARTRPPKRRMPLPLSERWRAAAIRASGACTVCRLAERARVWPVVNVALAAFNTVAVVYVMRGAFQRQRLLAEACRHLACALHGRPHQPGLDEQIVQPVRTTTPAPPTDEHPGAGEETQLSRPFTRRDCPWITIFHAPHGCRTVFALGPAQGSVAGCTGERTVSG
ncbi:hypothetical protein AB0N17_45625 [Streptomyces sp. NPDC051133]|uniref:hypothetical protein n=1 Tax=Streptomyces sp. NPDC051133 TaxID=3155521 RepID=UPI003416B204